MESPLVGTRTPVTLGNRNDKRSPDDSVRSSSVVLEYDEETLDGDTDNDDKAGIDSPAVDSNKKNAVLGAELPGNSSIRNINWTCPSFEHRETGQNASATCNQVPADVPQGNALQHAPSAIAMTDSFGNNGQPCLTPAFCFILPMYLTQIECLNHAAAMHAAPGVEHESK